MLPSLSSGLLVDRTSSEAHGRFRTLPQRSGTIDFCANDYLGLAGDPRLGLAAAAAATEHGFGAGAARLVAPDLPVHRALEAGLARELGHESALLFPTGYHANIGVLGALAAKTDLIVSDEANHASLIDGCRLSRARVAVFRHGDADDAARVLADARTFRRRLLVTESLFSMEGDLAPLADLAAVARRFDAALVVDEAHALGVIGPGGRGLCAEVGVEPDALVGTLGKAFGTFGGFVAGTSLLRDHLINHARTFIFTTAHPAPLAAAALAGFEIACSADGDARRARLRENVSALRAFLHLPASQSPILPLVLGTEPAALAASAALAARGFHVQAIRPPTVPAGSSRLRVTLSAAHAPEAVAALARALREVLPA